MELQGGHYGSPRWTWEILDCSMPMTFDTYSNCAFQCVYCFAFFQRAVGDGREDYLHHKVESVDVEKVKKLFRGEIPKSQFNWYIQQRMVMQWGGMSDGWDHYERKFGKSLELLRFFREIDYPISISTKGVWFTEDPRYIEAFKGAKNIHMKSSIITLDEDKAHRVERGVATSEERFKMLEKMAEWGIPTTVRYRPFTLGISADFPYTHKSEQQIWAFVKRAKAAGCYSLTSEFMCYESRASNTAKERYDILSKISGFDQFALYKQVSQSRAGLLRLNYDLKRPYFETMREACDAVGLKFFISDAHHKEKSDGAGCCGLPMEGPLSNINRGQYAEAILVAKRNGRVAWSDISEAAENLKHIPFYAAEGFNQGGTDERVKRMYQTMYDYMRDIWNNPKSMMSPNRYFGGALVADEKVDANGDIVYLYNEPFVLNGEVPKDMADLQLKLVANGEAMGADGSPYGHVAYDVVVNAVGMLPHKNLVIDQINRNRLVPRVFVSNGTAAAWEKFFPDSEIVEVPASDLGPITNEEAVGVIQMQYTLARIQWAWVISGAALFVNDEGKQITPRAYLSKREAGVTDASNIDSGGIRLLQCATLSHEERAVIA